MHGDGGWNMALFLKGTLVFETIVKIGKDILRTRLGCYQEVQPFGKKREIMWFISITLSFKLSIPLVEDARIGGHCCFIFLYGHDPDWAFARLSISFG